MTQRLPQLLETYLLNHSVEESTKATIRFYRKEVGLFFRFLDARGHSMEPNDVSSLDVMAHLQDMKVRGLAPRTLRSRHQAILNFFRWAVEWNLVEENPAGRIKRPKIPKTRKPFLQPEAFRALLALCPANTEIGARRQAMLWMLLTTGIRRKELTDLLLEDVDWQADTVRIRLGKGQKERRVPLHQETKRALLRYIAHRTDGLLCLWVTEEHKRLAYDGIGQDINRLLERAGLQTKDVCHIFRRTWAANSVKQGIPRPYIQAVAGWSTPSMLDHYTQAMQDEEQAIEAYKDYDPFGRPKGVG